MSRDEALSEALELAERWKNIHTDEFYGPQGKNLGTLARALLAAQPSRERRAMTLLHRCKAEGLLHPELESTLRAFLGDDYV